MFSVGGLSHSTTERINTPFHYARKAPLPPPLPTLTIAVWHSNFCLILPLTLAPLINLEVLI